MENERLINGLRKHYPQINKVVDGKRPLVVEVTATDIKKSVKKDPAHCAMAEACKRQMNLDGAIVSRSMMYLVKGKKATRYVLPPAVRAEILSFDRGSGFGPGAFRISGIQPTWRLGHRPPRRTKKTGTHPKRQYRIVPGLRARVA